MSLHPTFQDRIVAVAEVSDRGVNWFSQDKPQLISSLSVSVVRLKDSQRSRHHFLLLFSKLIVIKEVK